MSMRIPISWIFLVALLGLVAFFTYHILSVSAKPKSEEDQFIKTIGHTQQPLVGAVSHHAEQVPEPTIAETHSELDTPIVTQTVPSVPGQTEQDLRATRQVQETPPNTHYQSPEAVDPFHRTIHMDAEFGSNVRHPEQMMEQRPRAGIAGIVPSGLGSEQSRPGGHNAAGYSPEMVQNAGEFMNGIAAFDGSDAGGIGFSVI
jgi:hypothetical protein